MCESTAIKPTKYFAAANSYNGFVSLFDKHFDSRDFDRIYVLKGGPGTGKSSFMKKASSLFNDRNCIVDEIYCSSDPHSLDGVIAKKNNKRIAIIDGTAPHERDAVIPGAIDEIVNLGNGWDSKWLVAKKSKILEVNYEKSSAYKCGYSYLKMAGAADRFVYDAYSSIFQKIKAKNKAEELLSDITTSQDKKSKCLFISSFGRYGSYKINENDCNLGRIVRVRGDDFSSTLFINTIREVARSRGLTFIDIKSPLEPSNSDGICFEEANVCFLKSDVGEINSNEFLENDKMYSERTRRAKEIKKTALEEAERWFSIASELHFQLESIYGSAMDFHKNTEMLDEKLGEMQNILEI